MRIWTPGTNTATRGRITDNPYKPKSVELCVSFGSVHYCHLELLPFGFACPSDSGGLCVFCLFCRKRGRHSTCVLERLCFVEGQRVAYVVHGVLVCSVFQTIYIGRLSSKERPFSQTCQSSVPNILSGAFSCILFLCACTLLLSNTSFLKLWQSTVSDIVVSSHTDPFIIWDWTTIRSTIGLLHISHKGSCIMFFSKFELLQLL